MFGADDEVSFHRFEFNDYPSEVFYPSNDFYNLDRNISNVDLDGSAAGLEGDDGSSHPKTGNGDNWIRKSFEQLTQNQTPVIRPKFQPRSKSLESETRTVNPDSETDVAECDSFYDNNKSTSFCCDDCNNGDDDGDGEEVVAGDESRQNEKVVVTKNVELIGG